MAPNIASSDIPNGSSSKRQVASPQPPPAKRVRVRTGCLTCRRRRRKCDETRPSCNNCVGRNSQCEWGIKATWREENAKCLTPEHEHSFSLVQPQFTSAMPDREYKIIDLTSNISSHYNATPRPRSLSISTVSGNINDDFENDDGDDEEGQISTETINDVTSPYLASCAPEKAISFVDVETSDSRTVRNEASSPSMNVIGPESASPTHGEQIITDRSSHPPQAVPSPNYSMSIRSPAYTHHYSPMSIDQGISPGSCSIDTTHSASFAAIELMALSQQTPRTVASRHSSLSHSQTSEPGRIVRGENTSHHTPTNTATSVCSPSFDTISNNSAFVGTSYEELQNTLRHHIFLTTRSDVPTREGSPGVDDIHRRNFDDKRPATPSTLATLRERNSITKKPPDTALQREAVLLKNYLDEVAPWLDMFDNQRHFEHVIPIVAKSSEHLKFSILALSARQLELADPRKKQPGSESLSLYHQAIIKLLPQLESKTNDVVASCVILCVLEMMSCSPQDWRRHLEGCATLIDSAGLHGNVGGLGQSLFWCFARMDVCGGIIAEESTIVPLGKWAGHPHLGWNDSIQLFQTAAARDFDMYANYSVFLCATALDLLASADANRNTEAYRERWRTLWGLLQEWHANRPEAMQPLMTLPADPDDGAKPFPKILYGNSPAISGNQLYHTSSILLAQAKPKGERLAPGSKSIIWHARQVCGISATNTHHGCWSNALQPLWVAGRLMSHPSEHRVILDTLSRIERETGWKMSWRAEDLMEFWGCHD
ncbi:fungal-specific transcription factor domain-containing protein [Geopyxis carbonaria]|nr:fungal-specific transcription factor domain-containing protein [Geopyxis carbonaria]